MPLRTIIAGGPKTGKTTHAGFTPSIPTYHTDDLIGKLGWSEASEEIATWFDRDGPWVIEGVDTVRALRKWLARGTGAGTPADVVIFFTLPRILLTPKQEGMTKGIETIWKAIKPRLLNLDVEVIEI